MDKRSERLNCTGTRTLAPRPPVVSPHTRRFTHTGPTMTEPASTATASDASAAAVPAKKLYTLADLKAHATEASCWVLIHGKVYDVTPFLDEHPGGFDIILSSTGKREGGRGVARGVGRRVPFCFSLAPARLHVAPFFWRRLRLCLRFQRRRGGEAPCSYHPAG